jgi:hypothetical protein
MLRLATVALMIIALGVVIGALIAHTIPPASTSHEASSWQDSVGNRRAATAPTTSDQTAVGNDGFGAPAAVPAQVAGQPYGPDNRDRIVGRDGAAGAAGYNDNVGDGSGLVDDSAAQAADAARDAADDARAAAAAPPEPMREDR